MEAYAVIEAGGQQYRVEKGATIEVDHLDAKVGGKVQLSPVLAISDGKKLTVGTPHVKGAKVKAEVLEHLRGRKVVAFKKKRRKGYRRKIGHRQELTKLKILEW
jgi:large subunit ribosomal protein L21